MVVNGVYNKKAIANWLGNVIKEQIHCLLVHKALLSPITKSLKISAVCALILYKWVIFMYFFNLMNVKTLTCIIDFNCESIFSAKRYVRSLSASAWEAYWVVCCCLFCASIGCKISSNSSCCDNMKSNSRSSLCCSAFTRSTLKK